MRDWSSVVCSSDLAMEFEYLLLESADDEELFQHPDEAERILASPVRLRHLDAVPRRLHRDGNEPCHEEPPAGESKHLCWSAEISDGLHPIGRRKIGRASCRERVCQYG